MDEWTVSEAAEAVGYSEQSVRRWVEAAAQAAPGAVAVEDFAVHAQASPELDEETRTLNGRDHADAAVVEAAVAAGPPSAAPRNRALEANRGGLPAREGASGRAAGWILREGARRFEAAAPLELIQADLFYVRRKEGGYFYGLSVMDDHSRFVLGVPVLEEQTAEAALEAFRRTVNGRRLARVLTDRGPQFYAWRGRTAFQAYVEDELWALHILAAPQHPQTLGKVERFHGTLRTEALTEKDGYASRDQVQLLLDRYVAYYNYVRPHQGMGGLTPADRFFGFTRPLQEALKDPEGPRPGQGFFLALNLAGRRLVVAGERPDQVRVLWDDAETGRHVPALPPAACPPSAP